MALREGIDLSQRDSFGTSLPAEGLPAEGRHGVKCLGNPRKEDKKANQIL